MMSSKIFLTLLGGSGFDICAATFFHLYNIRESSKFFYSFEHICLQNVKCCFLLIRPIVAVAVPFFFFFFFLPLSMPSPFRITRFYCL